MIRSAADIQNQFVSTKRRRITWRLRWMDWAITHEVRLAETDGKTKTTTTQKRLLIITITINKLPLQLTPFLRLADCGTYGMAWSWTLRYFADPVWFWGYRQNENFWQTEAPQGKYAYHLGIKQWDSEIYYTTLQNSGYFCNISRKEIEICTRINGVSTQELDVALYCEFCPFHV